MAIKQIIEKELPVGYLVLDYWVPSGNVEFIIDTEIPLDFYTDETIKKILGTKHIKLIDVNTDIEWFGEGPSAECYFIDRDGYGIYKGADALSASGSKQDGKDFFIYKVSEEKDV